MTLNNFKVFLGVAWMGPYQNARDAKDKIINTNGEEVEITKNSYYATTTLAGAYYPNPNFSVYTGNGMFYIYLGNGTGTITENDYQLFNTITDYSAITGEMIRNGSKDYLTIFTKTILNTSDAAITITELGLYHRFSSSEDPEYLLAHEMLAEPVVIQPGETYSFTLKLSI